MLNGYDNANKVDRTFEQAGCAVRTLVWRSLFADKRAIGLFNYFHFG
jgi:hypothetical protein